MTPWPISMSNILKGQSPSLNQFASHSNFLLKARHQISAIRFKNVQIVAHVFLGCQFLEKYRIIHFYQFLMHQKKKIIIIIIIIKKEKKEKKIRIFCNNRT